jgi:hypothetical protein
MRILSEKDCGGRKDFRLKICAYCLSLIFEGKYLLYSVEISYFEIKVRFFKTNYFILFFICEITFPYFQKYSLCLKRLSRQIKNT